MIHRKAIPHGEVAAAIAKARSAKPGKVDTLAFEFLVLTAAAGLLRKRGLGDQSGSWIRGSADRDPATVEL